MEDEMRFINYIKPPLENGKYTVRAVQQVELPQSCEYREEKEFHIAGNAFRLGEDDVFSVYPAANETGEFANILPFLVMERRTFPWEYRICADRDDGTPVPWTALIVLSEQESWEQKDMQIQDLLEKKEEGVYFPSKDIQDVFCEKKTDSCHVIDLPGELCDSVLPSVDDLPYLCHARSVNLSRTEDDICAKDGFFSVVCANRFVPSGEDAPLKSTVHLVSMLGMGDFKALPDGCKKVRLVSLYHWDIYSQKQSGENFAAVIAGLKQNCGVINSSMDTELKRQGYSIKGHITRTGERTWSLYRPPLLPFRREPRADTGNRQTADGRLIYDSENGLFDVTYAAAWQLGRIIALGHPAETERMMQQRRNAKMRVHKDVLQASINFDKIGVEKLAVRLAGTADAKGILDRGGSYEEDSVERADSSTRQSVFRGYR